MLDASPTGLCMVVIVSAFILQGKGVESRSLLDHGLQLASGLEQEEST